MVDDMVTAAKAPANACRCRDGYWKGFWKAETTATSSTCSGHLHSMTSPTTTSTTSTTSFGESCLSTSELLVGLGRIDHFCLVDAVCTALHCSAVLRCLCFDALLCLQESLSIVPVVVILCVAPTRTWILAFWHCVCIWSYAYHRSLTIIMVLEC